MKPLLRFTTIVFVLIVFCSMSPGENSPPPSLAAARAALMRGDSAGAARIVEAVVAREPKNAAAWRFLGNASKQTKNYSRALEAFQRALALDPSNPGPIYQIGTVYALQGARDARIPIAVKGAEDGPDRYDADRDRSRTGIVEKRSAIPRSASESSRLRPSVRRAGEDRARMGWRACRRSVWLDRARDRRRRWRRRRRRRHIRADLRSEWIVGRTCVCLFDRQRQIAVVFRRSSARSIRYRH